jgi:hypothetical protein
MSQNGTNKSTLTCQHCNQRFSAPAPALEEPLNTLRSSVAVAPHEKPIRCPNAKCKQYFVWGIVEAQFQWTIIPITDEQAATITERPNLIIAPPPSLAIN